MRPSRRRLFSTGARSTSPIFRQHLTSERAKAVRGLGSIVTSLSQRPGLYTKVHVHGTSGASVGVETDRGATFVAGVSAIAEPPLNDLWTIPGEEHLLADFQAEDRARFAAIDATTHYHALQIRDCTPRISFLRIRDRANAR